MFGRIYNYNIIGEVKPGFHVNKIPDDQGFHCFPTVLDFAIFRGRAGVKQLRGLRLRAKTITDFQDSRFEFSSQE